LNAKDRALEQLSGRRQPEVPDGDWFKDFGSFKICGQGPLAKTFLLQSQIAKGQKL